MDRVSLSETSPEHPRGPSGEVPRAARDLILIVLGVLLALGADSWREARQERVAELTLLRVMRAALAEERVGLEDAVAGFEQAEAANLFLQEHLARRRGYADSLDTYFGLVYATGGVPPLNVAPYEALKAQGLQIVEREPLRLQIIAVYENTYGILRRQNDFNVDVVFDVLRPYYLAHFRDLRFGVNATPLTTTLFGTTQCSRTCFSIGLISFGARLSGRL